MVKCAEFLGKSQFLEPRYLQKRLSNRLSPSRAAASRAAKR
jgi:hypothetical protein